MGPCSEADENGDLAARLTEDGDPATRLTEDGDPAARLTEDGDPAARLTVGGRRNCLVVYRVSLQYPYNGILIYG